MQKYFRLFKMIAPDGVTRGRVYAKQGKRGFNLGVTVKGQNVKAFTTEQVTLETQAASDEAFDKLVAKVTSKGWGPRGDSNGRRRFAEVPMAPGFVAPAPVADVAADASAPVTESEAIPEAAAKTGSARKR